MVRALGALYLVGPSVAALSLILPHAPQTNTTPIWFAIAAVYAMAPLIFRYYGRLPDWAISATIAVTNLAVTVGIYFNHEATSFYAFFYLWVTPYAAAFFSARHALGHVVLIGARVRGDAGAARTTTATARRATPSCSSGCRRWRRCWSPCCWSGRWRGALRENMARLDEERRRRAMEINDDVVQRLVLARQSCEAGEPRTGTSSSTPRWSAPAGSWPS